MTITRDQAQMLATLVCAARPTGARQWKPEDVYTELAKLKDRSLGSVICAATRAAMDRHAERPEVIASSGSHWGDTLITTDWVPNAVDRATRCTTCSEDYDRCRRKWSDDHEFQSAADAARTKDEAEPETVRRVVEALKDEVAHADPETVAPPKTLDDLAAADPELHARVARVREQIPTEPTRETSPPPAAIPEKHLTKASTA